MKTEEALRFEAQVTEVGSDPRGSSWDGPGVYRLPGMDIAEMTRGDDDPFFVELLVLKEGVGTGRPAPKRYSSEAVESCAQVLPGVMGYLGHQKPGERDFEYRAPQARILMSRVENVSAPDGQVVKVARAKGYVSRRAVDLRAHLREGLAGPVSIDGRAILEKQGDEIVVTEITGLRSVDFCNPGTEGVQGAGVLAVVSEMDGPEGNSNHREGDMPENARLTREQLLAEYGADIREMVREAVENQRKPLDEKVRTVEEALVGKDKEIERLKADGLAREKEIGEMRSALVEANGALATRDLQDHLAGLLASREDLSDTVREMVTRRVDLRVLDADPDLSKSKAAVQSAVDGALAEIEEIAEMTGGTLAKRDESGSMGARTGASGNPPRRSVRDSRVELARSILARGAELYPEK